MSRSIKFSQAERNIRAILVNTLFPSGSVVLNATRVFSEESLFFWRILIIRKEHCDRKCDNISHVRALIHSQLYIHSGVSVNLLGSPVQLSHPQYSVLKTRTTLVVLNSELHLLKPGSLPGFHWFLCPSTTS